MERLSIEVVENATKTVSFLPETPFEKVLAYCMTDYLEMRKSEEQGLLLRLPVAIGETCWGWEYQTRIDEEDGSEWIICNIRRAKVVPKKFNIFMLDRFGENYFATKEEAEQALKQMGE